MAQRWRIHLPIQEMRVPSLDPENPLEKELATHSSIPASEIPWIEDPGSPWGHKRVGHDLATKNNKKKTRWQDFRLPYFGFLQRHNFISPSLISVTTHWFARAGTEDREEPWPPSGGYNVPQQLAEHSTLVTYWKLSYFGNSLKSIKQTLATLCEIWTTG